MTNSKAAKETIPVILRTRGPYELVSAFRTQVQGERGLGFAKQLPGDKKKYIALGQKSMIDIIDCVAPTKVKSLASLDCCSEVHGRDNFVNIRELLEHLRSYTAVLQISSAKIEEAKGMVDQAESFVKSRCGFWSKAHFRCKDNDGPSCHCRYFTFGKRDPSVPKTAVSTDKCGHNHTGVCKECEVLTDLPLLVDTIWDDVQSNAEGYANQIGESENIKSGKHVLSHMQQIVEQKEYYLLRYFHYIGHQARLCNEADLQVWVAAHLRENPHVIAIDVDWAMKFLSLRYREKMSDFFGKRGIAWFGGRVMWYDPAKDLIQYYFVHQICENDAENGVLSIQCLVTLLNQHRLSHPIEKHTDIILGSDGAGCFEGIDFTARLPYLHLAIQWNVTQHHIGENGGGKDRVDASFGAVKPAIRRYVTQKVGKADIKCPKDLVAVIQAAVPAKTIAWLMSSVRNSIIEPIKTREVTDAGLQSVSLRKFTYDEEGNPLTIECYKQSGMGGPPDSVIKVPALWSTTDVSLIIPIGVPTACESVIVPSAPKECNNLLDAPKECLGVYLTPEQKMEKQKMVDDRRETKRSNLEETITAAALAAKQTSRKFPCDYPNCVRVFKGEKCLSNHTERGDHSSNGSMYCVPAKVIAPSEYSHLSRRDIALNVFKEVMQIETPESAATRSFALDACTIDLEEDSNFVFGWGNRKQLKHPKIKGEILEGIHSMYEWGEQEGNPKLQPTTMQDYLKEVGLHSLLQKMPGNGWLQQLTETHGGIRPYFHASLIPEEFRIKQITNSIGTKKKQAAQDKATPLLNRQYLEDDMVVRLSAIAAELDGHDPVSVKDELIRRGVGTGSISLKKLIPKNLLNLPEDATEKWSFKMKTAICGAVKNVGTNLPVPHAPLIPIQGGDIEDYDDPELAEATRRQEYLEDMERDEGENSEEQDAILRQLYVDRIEQAEG